MSHWCKRCCNSRGYSTQCPLSSLVQYTCRTCPKGWWSSLMGVRPSSSRNHPHSLSWRTRSCSNNSQCRIYLMLHLGWWCNLWVVLDYIHMIHYCNQIRNTSSPTGTGVRRSGSRCSMCRWCSCCSCCSSSCTDRRSSHCLRTPSCLSNS